MLYVLCQMLSAICYMIYANDMLYTIYYIIHTMLWYIILWYTLHYTIHYTIMYCTIHYTKLHCTVLYCTGLYYTNIILRYTTQRQSTPQSLNCNFGRLGWVRLCLAVFIFFCVKAMFSYGIVVDHWCIDRFDRNIGF